MRLSLLSHTLCDETTPGIGLDVHEEAAFVTIRSFGHRTGRGTTGVADALANNGRVDGRVDGLPALSRVAMLAFSLYLDEPT